MFGIGSPAAPPAGSGLRRLPSLAGVPVLGLIWRYQRDPLRFARDTYDRFGPLSTGDLVGRKTLFALGPDATGEVLANRNKAFANGPGWEFAIGPFFKRGIMLLDFEEHLYHRRIMQQAFTKDRLSAYLDGMTPTVDQGLAEWAPADSFQLNPAIKRLTLDLAAGTFLGGDLGANADRANKAFIDCVDGGAAYVRYPVPGGAWSRGLAGRRLLERTFRERLPAKRACDGDDLFSALCHAVSEEGERFSDDDVINHVIFLMLAAHDTTTTTLATMGFYLAKHPEWQQRCREEARALGASPITFDDLDALQSVDLVMKESLRMCAPIPIMFRSAVKDTEVLGHYIPKDMLVVLLPHFLHYMPEYWKDPETFDPERFTEQRREDRLHKNIWMPFGGGVHKCIGLHFAGVQVKAILHQLLQRFEWSVDPGYEVPWDRKSLPVPKDGLPVRLWRL